MVLGIWEFNATRADDEGIVRVIPGAQVTVRRESDLELATLFQNAGGGSPLSNPFEAGARGEMKFYADADQLYWVEIADGELVKDLRHQSVHALPGARPDQENVWVAKQIYRAPAFETRMLEFQAADQSFRGSIRLDPSGGLQITLRANAGSSSPVAVQNQSGNDVIRLTVDASDDGIVIVRDASGAVIATVPSS